VQITKTVITKCDAINFPAKIYQISTNEVENRLNNRKGQSRRDHKKSSSTEEEWDFTEEPNLGSV
jgi:hypothetical protein